MQEDRIDGAEWLVRTPTRVHGMGLCDVLRVELQPCQIAGAIDEVEERRGPLNEAFEHARTRWDAIAESERGDANARNAEQELSRSAYALRVLRLIRSQLPTADHAEPVSLVGPASTISELIAASTWNAVDDLRELMRESCKTDREAQARLRAALSAVAAWVETYIECEALEWFTFDSQCDPCEPTE